VVCRSVGLGGGGGGGGRASCLSGFVWGGGGRGGVVGGGVLLGGGDLLLNKGHWRRGKGWGWDSEVLASTCTCGTRFDREYEAMVGPFLKTQLAGGFSLVVIALIRDVCS